MKASGSTALTSLVLMLLFLSYIPQSTQAQAQAQAQINFSSNSTVTSVSDGHVITESTTAATLATTQGVGLGACATSTSCQECSRSAKHMLQSSSGQYTCLWKWTPMEGSEYQNPENENKNQDEDEESLLDKTKGIHLEHIEDPNHISKKKRKKKKTNENQGTLSCDLIPFSTDVIAESSVSCSDPRNIMGASPSTTQQIVRQRRRTHILHTISSTMIVLLFAFIMLRARAMILGKPFLPDSWKKTYKQYRLRNNKSKSGGNIAIANSVAGGIPAILTMMGGAISSNNTTSNSNSSSRSGSSSRGGNGNGNGKGKHQPKMSGKFSFSTFITHKKTDTNSEPNTYLSDQKVNKT